MSPMGLPVLSRRRRAVRRAAVVRPMVTAQQMVTCIYWAMIITMTRRLARAATQPQAT